MTEEDLKEETSRELLCTDFSQSFQQMRHYDMIEISIAKFALTGITSVIAASLLLYRLGLETRFDFSRPIGFILVLSFTVGLIMIAMVVRNRCYYVTVTRHVNQMRNLYIKQGLPGFELIKGIYSEEKTPAFFNPVSTYSLMLYLLCLLNSIMLAGSIYILTQAHLRLAFIILIVSMIFHLAIGISYLKSKEKKEKS